MFVFVDGRVKLRVYNENVSDDADETKIFLIGYTSTCKFQFIYNSRKKAYR